MWSAACAHLRNAERRAVVAKAVLGAANDLVPHCACSRPRVQVGGFDKGDVPAVREGEWEDSAQAAQLEDNYGDMPGAQLVAPPTATTTASTTPAVLARRCTAHDGGRQHPCTDHGVHQSEPSEDPIYRTWPPACSVVR